MSDTTLNYPQQNGVTQARAGLSFTPHFDLWENDNEFQLIGDLPGVDSQDLEIQFENQELRIHAKVAPRQSNVNYLQEEYGIGDFYRSFTVGESVDGTAVAAELKDGVLTVHLPKRPDVRPRKIEVKAT